MPASAPPKPAIAAEITNTASLVREQVHAEGGARRRAVAHRDEPTPERARAGATTTPDADDAEHRGDEEQERGVLRERRSRGS